MFSYKTNGFSNFFKTILNKDISFISISCISCWIKYILNRTCFSGTLSGF
uniref:Uncharacterized protein n=1 Tax=Chlamydia pneumoniae TaxID=83558 RepID=A0A0F7XBK4_CHLPN|nr:hypothetical protein BN1224_Panola_F_00160 [Chlamydia pneumoniae]